MHTLLLLLTPGQHLPGIVWFSAGASCIQLKNKGTWQAEGLLVFTGKYSASYRWAVGSRKGGWSLWQQLLVSGQHPPAVLSPRDTGMGPTARHGSRLLRLGSACWSGRGIHSSPPEEKVGLVVSSAFVPSLLSSPTAWAKAQSSQKSFPLLFFSIQVCLDIRFASVLFPTPTRNPETSQELSSTPHRRSPVPTS